MRSLPMPPQREAFVSGLPSPRPAPPLPHAPGIEAIERARALMLTEIARLKPYTVARFDGEVRLPADDEAIADSKTYADIVRLIDLIAADSGIKVTLAQAMTEGGT